MTIAVAWELARAVSRVRPALLAAAREHAAWRIPAEASLADTEAIAILATREFIARRSAQYRRWQADPDLDVLPDPRWRQAVVETATPLHEAVFRLHYGDGVPLEELPSRLRIDLSWLRPAREAVRELVKVIVAEDGVATNGWEPARVDRLVTRVALAAADRCPGPGGLATESGRAHGESCPRCGRALRLIREGVISPGDLFAPDGPVPPANTMLTLVHLHPDARTHARALVLALPSAVRVADDQFVYVHDATSDAALHELCESATPARSHLRIVRGSVPGRIVDGVLVGRAFESLHDAVQLLPWGEVRGVEPLPEPLPAAPSAARWWAVAGLVGILALGAAVLATQTAGPGRAWTVEASRDSTGVVFEVADGAFVDVLAVAPQHAEVLFHSADPADKAVLATSDGRYRQALDGRPILIIAAGAPLDDTAAVVAAALDVDDVRVRLRSRYPEAAIVIVR
ncbi:MAG: hypothetical protein EXR71_09160 [Myxococcales bacterium]|nr:hypothetical protein [Myxococcales bacterium]